MVRNRKPKVTISGPASTSPDALAESLQAMSITGPRSTPSSEGKTTSKAELARVKKETTPFAELMPPFGSTPVLYGPRLLAIKSQALKSWRGASSTGSESSSQLLMAFFSESGDSMPSSNWSSLDGRSYKLALWQAILVTVGVCESDEGIVMPGLKRPSHFPKTPLPLPNSLTACRSLIRKYVFLNIINFKRSQIDMERLRLFSNVTELRNYTVKKHRFIKLGKAKDELLNPLLRDIFVQFSGLVGHHLHKRLDLHSRPQSTNRSGIVVEEVDMKRDASCFAGHACLNRPFYQDQPESCRSRHCTS